MSASIARSLKPVDSLEVSVLVDKVVDPLSTLPKGVAGEHAVLRGKGMKLIERRGATVVNSPEARAIMEQMFYLSGGFRG